MEQHNYSNVFVHMSEERERELIFLKHAYLFYKINPWTSNQEQPFIDRIVIASVG